MIEDQILFWMKKNTAEKNNKYTSRKLPIITISREFGAHGAALATKLGEELGFKVWDRDLLVIISEQLGTSADYIKGLDEARRGMLEDTIFGFMHQRETNLNYLIYLVRAVRTLERIGNNVIVGRGANYICRDQKSFHIRVVCPLKTRIYRYAKKEHLSIDEATEIVLTKDMERSNFVKHNFNRNAADAFDYDLTLNSETYTIEEMAKLATRAYELKTGVMIQQDTQAIVA
ncbi:Cytidylate kinase [Gracilimonas mengyeensis]|uniref:Cytidylate kinase n=2 Tax=Gracilimonas mengyeensis TaxID=1302730 RepID=A0A521FAT0_9BACT|nr:Cytidylate kinase [Gracilimonas mengyeensis]